ncbi:hypothetical protein UFOVP121_31 [uncultured Caudovirales phage]|uniref:Large polyvalent protein associated domain-containing protein n=1 Tax=uncultured Caudovirales phage TaxID=2100421 RepID=A0A6J5LL37_9CAUD|nr:hypothetical protein UFOVP121_31 [uncultured Caudovirales phage]CAB4134935.1 hypothetical protein UFOVP277_36 [uncultured Caudovirales phage]
MADDTLLSAPTASPLNTQLAEPTFSPVAGGGLRDMRRATQGIEPGRSSFESGARAGLQGVEVGLRALAANAAEVAGAPEYAKSQLGEISRIKAEMPQGTVSRIGQIHNANDIGEFASYTFGQALPTIATAAGGALAGRLGARSLGLRMTPGQAEFAGGALGVFPQEAGETAAQMYESPEAMQLSPGQRLAIAAGKGAVTSAMENVVPAMVMGKVARGAAPALEQGFVPAAKYIGKEAVKAGGLEGLTELAQGATGQAAMHLAAPQSEDLLMTPEDAATQFFGGLIPGKVMGGVGAAAQLARSKMGEAADMATPDKQNTIKGLIDTARNPQLSQFVSTLKPPADVVAGGSDAVANWIHDSGQINSVLASAANVAADESLPAGVRERAQALVQSGGDPEQLSQFAGLAMAHQRGLEAGQAVQRLGSAAMRSVFGQRAPGNDEKFSAMSVPLTEADAPLVQALSPFLRNSDQEAVQQTVPLIRDYLAAANDNPDAKMPVGMLALFGPNQSREGLRAATTMLQRMGVLNPTATTADYNGVIDDVLQRQKLWRSLISTNLAPEHGELRAGDANKLASVLESLAAETASTRASGMYRTQQGEDVYRSDPFMDAVTTAFGKNAPRALESMQALLPQGMQSQLTNVVGMQNIVEPGATGAALESSEAKDVPTAGENLASLGMTAKQSPVADAKWSFANNQTKELYDTGNATQMEHLASNSERLTRSGNAEAVPTGVAEYARLTGDTDALEKAKAAMPGATDSELNDRFKVLGVYQTGTPEAEQITYDELVGGKSPWRSEFGAIKLYEPGKKAATLITTPGQIIKQMRAKEQNTVSGLQGAESAASDFSRAMSALLNVQKNDQPAFDRVEVLNKDGQYVPLSEMPDDFSLFQGVTVGAAKKALSERMQGEGVNPDARLRKATTPQIREMGLIELRNTYAQAVARYREASGKNDIVGAGIAKRRIDAIRNEIKRRLVRDGLDASLESIQAALMGGTSVSPTTLAPDANMSAATRERVTTSPTSRFTTRAAAEAFLDEQGGRGTITQQGKNFIVSGYATVTQPGALTTPMESEEFATASRDLGNEDNVTPGDIEAAQQGARLFQEETGQLLHPAQHRTGDSARSQVIASARRLAEAVSSAAPSSIKRTILQELSAATNDDVSDTALRGRVKAAERSALLNGLISPDMAIFQHQGVLSKLAKPAENRGQALEGLKFTSVEPGVTEAMTDEDKADVQEWMARVLPDAVVSFVKELGGMSGSYSKDAAGKALIKINVFASDPLGVAFHEALHDLFSTLSGGRHKGTLDMLKRVASSAIIKRQLNKLLEGNPAAQAQLKDPEEAAAYLFQFWMSDMIQIGPQNETFFGKVIRALKNFVGVFSDEEMAIKVFTAFNEGKLGTEVSRDETLTGFNTGGYQQFKSYAKPITTRLGKLTDSVDSRFRETNNPHLIEIIDNFNNAVGSDGTKLGFYAAVAQARNRLISQLTETFRGYDRAKLDDALDALQQERNPNLISDADTRAIVKDVRATLDKLYTYMERKGVTNWEGKPVGRLENYFPRLWSVDALVADGDKFVEDLLANHKDDLDGIAATANQQSADAGINSTVDARAVAEAILSKLTRNNGVLDDATNSRESSVREVENVLGFSPAMAAANERVLKFLDMKVFSKYLQKDLVFAMTQYINQAVKRAEYSERFGSDGSKLEQMMADAQAYEVNKRMRTEYGPEYERTRNRALATTERKKGEPQDMYEQRALGQYMEGFADAHKAAADAVSKDFETYRAGVMALEGTLGHDISNELRQFNSAMMTYQNIRTIPLALLSSFIDPLGIMVRGGEMKHAYKAFTRGLGEVVKSWKGEMSGAEDPAVAMAELLGTLEPSSYLDSLGQTYGSMYMTGKARHINDFFFRLNGMEGWNRAMRTQATLAAIDFIKKLKTDPDRNTERYLKELGLTADDIVLKDDGSLDLSSTDKRLQFAIMRWVDGAVLRPNAAQRPAWASNPKYALLFHLNQFTYSFHKVILERMYHEAKNGNYDPLMVAAAGYVPVMLAANIIRAFITGGGEEPDWMKGQDSLVDWVKRAVQGAGLTGVPGAISEKFPFGLAGPTVQQALDAVFKDKDLTDTFEKSLPLQSIYRHW